MPTPASEDVRLPWVRRPWLLGGFVGGCLLLMLGSFVAGRLVHPASDLLEAGAPVVGPTFAALDERVVQETSIRTGQVVGARVVDVPAPPVTGTGAVRSVVTRSVLRVGSTARAGSLLAVVSGRPVFLLELPVPLYRPLHDGDRGDDVLQVQRALRLANFPTPVDGTFGPSTQAAVTSLYRASGFTPRREAPDGPAPSDGVDDRERTVWLPVGEVFGIARAKAVVAAATARGTVLTDSAAPVARLRVGGLRVIARVGVDERDLYRTGRTVRVSASDLTSKTWRGVVTSVSTFQEDAGAAVPESSEPQDGAVEDDETTGDADQEGVGSDLPGYDISIRITGDTEALVSGRSVSVLPAARVSARNLAAPLIAIRQNGSGSYVRVEDTAAPGGAREVRVEVTGDADGWAALAPGSGLEPGTRVQVTP